MKTVYCGNCPCGVWQDSRLYCGLTQYETTERDNLHYQDEPDCPLKRLELKDGFVFVPEVQGE